MILVIDYGLGNVGSLHNMLKRAGLDSSLVSDPASLSSGDRYILPGVGSFDTCMNRLRASGFIEPLEYQVLNKKKPILGICVGMQMFFESSEEGESAGLGWLKGNVVKFNQAQSPYPIKIPHMGWSEVFSSRQSRLSDGLEKNARFYFVHSYYVHPSDSADVVLHAEHGIKFAAAVQHENIMGVQFHPEKSHKFGMQLLKNFALSI